MKKNLNYNYINTLPDFLAMQRISFCWFISKGLTQELSLFSRIHDFTANIEYIIFGEEYKLIKPSYTLLTARKYSNNYKAQLIVPVEIRNKILNSIKYRSKFPITNLPLMSSDATFMIYGCDRVIVSQIIRSPGIYFEKNKNQKIRNQFKRISYRDITKLRSFIPSGDAFISEPNLFFTVPTRPKTKIIANWSKGSIYYYSIKGINQIKKSSTFCFLKYFKLYQIISKTKNKTKKKQLIKLFIKWIKITNKTNYFQTIFLTENLDSLLKYFNFLVKILVKYQIFSNDYLSQRTLRSKTNNLEQFQEQNNYFKILQLFNLPSITLLKLLILYDDILNCSQNDLHVKLNSDLLFVTQQPLNWFIDLKNFSFLSKQISYSVSNLTNFTQFLKFQNLCSKIDFSITTKDLSKYRSPSKKRYHEEFQHKYLRTRTQFLLYKNDYEIQTNYNKRYDKKELYTATLIPESGSWIRLFFQKNTKINSYNYPVKNQEDEIIIQLDKTNQKPVLSLLRDTGLTDLEIYQSLEHAEFFYFDKPLLINSRYSNQLIARFDLDRNYLKSLSEFSKIFNPTFYQLGKIGRLKLNERLNLKLSNQIQSITYEDLFAIIDKLVNLSISKTIQDDIDHLKNRRVRSIGELLQNIFQTGFQRLIRTFRNQTNKTDSNQILSFNIVDTTIREFFGSSQLYQNLDQTNPISSLTHRRRIRGLGPGGRDRDRISFAVRDIHPSHYGRICPIETPEGQNVGLIASLTTCARVNSSGFLETPFWRVVNGRVLKTSQPIYLTADIEDLYKIAPADIAINKNNYLIRNVITVRYQQDFISVTPSNVDFIAISTVQVVSIAASLIPFFEHDDANRALMGSNMQRQSVPLILPQKPIVGTGLENQIAMDSGLTLNSQFSGIVNLVTANKIIISNNNGKKSIYKLQKYLRSNQQTCINQRPIVWKGERIKSGQILTDGPAITSSELSLGQNVLAGYMPWQGYNFEDAILISERLVYDDIFTSIHIERYKIEIDKSLETSEKTTKIIPNLEVSELEHLNDEGIVIVGTFVKSGDILVGKVIAETNSEQFPESKLLRAIFGTKTKGIKDTSYRMPNKNSGRVIETISFNKRTKLSYNFFQIYIFIAQIRKIKVGDKIAGRHGNKGIISKILPRQDMPFLPDGTPIDVILNPLGVPSRMNVGQLYECLLGFAGDKLNSRFKILPFDEMYGIEASRILINKKLRQASIAKNESWIFNPYAPGKMVLIDGRTGLEFENPVTVGNAYMLKLIHLVDDKMHARALGPYSLVTQQPLRGKAQHGGQRFGEMEVWALEGFGAAFTLKELLTIKSDDMEGRSKTLTAIVKGQPILEFGIPESFKVLLQELRSIGLDISTYKINNFSSDKDYGIEINVLEEYNALSKTFSPISSTNDIPF